LLPPPPEEEVPIAIGSSVSLCCVEAARAVRNSEGTRKEVGVLFWRPLEYLDLALAFSFVIG
jgi:hypothetical protein